MEEEYLLNKMIKGKTEKEREIELMQNIIETRIRRFLRRQCMTTIP